MCCTYQQSEEDPQEFNMLKQALCVARAKVGWKAVCSGAEGREPPRTSKVLLHQGAVAFKLEWKFAAKGHLMLLQKVHLVAVPWLQLDALFEAA